MSLIITEVNVEGFEKVIDARCDETGLECVIAIHSTKLGPALGGTRIWSYEKPEDALGDVLRLSEGMTYKNSLAGLNLGGGKGVINLGPNGKTPELLQAYGKVVDSLEGQYITAEDVGCSVEDMEEVNKTTEHVASLQGAGDPSPATALGVVRAMEAAVNFHRSEMAPGHSLEGLKVNIQGLGNVGYALAQMLHKKGCILNVFDIDPEKSKKLSEELGPSSGLGICTPSEIYSRPSDIFAPCALGAIINEDTIEKLNCKIVCGSANNQLVNGMAGYALMAKDIVYVPDYLANAGGVMNVYREFGEVDTDFHLANIIDEIYDRTLLCLRKSRTEKVPTNLIADEMAKARL